MLRHLLLAPHISEYRFGAEIGIGQRLSMHVSTMVVHLIRRHHDSRAGYLDGIGLRLGFRAETFELASPLEDDGTLGALLRPDAQVQGYIGEDRSVSWRSCD
jgi:hypothetical protein